MNRRELLRTAGVALVAPLSLSEEKEKPQDSEKNRKCCDCGEDIPTDWKVTIGPVEDCSEVKTVSECKNCTREPPCNRAEFGLGHTISYIYSDRTLRNTYSLVGCTQDEKGFWWASWEVKQSTLWYKVKKR